MATPIGIHIIIFTIEICFMRSFILGGGEVTPIYFIFPGLAFNYALISE